MDLTRIWRQFSHLAKYLLVAGVVAFISLLFPQEERFKYNYDKGGVWRYEDLISPADFPILKSEETLSEEKDRIRSEFIPYFERNNAILGDKLSAFDRLLNEEVQDMALQEPVNELILEEERYRLTGKDLIREVYQRGITPASQIDSIGGKGSKVYLVSGNEINLISARQLYTPTEARQYIRRQLQQKGLEEGSILMAILDTLIQANVSYSEEYTSKFLQEELNQVSSTNGMIQQGDLIVAEGQRITDPVFRELESYKKHYQTVITGDRDPFSIFIGYLLLTGIIVAVFLFYLQFHASQIYSHFNRLIFMLMWLGIFAYLVFAIENYTDLSTYIIPFCIVPIVVKNYFDDRLALFTHIVIVLIASFLSTMGYEFTFLQILAGIVTVLSIRETRYWGSFFQAILLIFATYVIGYYCLSVIKTGDLLDVNWTHYSWFVLSAILTLLAYPLIPLLERVFGFTSSITLAELTDMNRPLLRDLSVKASGTLQHSLQVANLAESAADAVGANTLLIKVGALYHDIGKMKNPKYFIENQSGPNPHDEIDERESAEIIIGHVTDGAKMAKKAGLPNKIIRFIKTHHGTTQVEYFYRSFKQKNPKEHVEIEQFTYPGPKPVTKEETILMLADTIEATSRAMKDLTAERIDGLVDELVKYKLEKGQLIESALSFRELEKCKRIFKKVLNSIYHVRIEYPDDESE